MTHANYASSLSVTHVSYGSSFSVTQVSYASSLSVTHVNYGSNLSVTHVNYGSSLSMTHVKYGSSLTSAVFRGEHPVKCPGRQPVMQLCDLAGIIGYMVVLISDLHTRNNCYEH